MDDRFGLAVEQAMRVHTHAVRVNRRARFLWETLESRVLLSTNLGGSPVIPQRHVRVPVSTRLPVAHITLASPSHKKGQAVPHSISPPGGVVTPSQMRQAYGMNQVMFGSIAGDGTGQTIAIVDAYDYPTAFEDLQAFDQAYGLPDPPSFQRVAQDGSQNFPQTDPTGGWEQEAALDIQWAHVMAPGANLILVEGNNNGYPNLIQNAVNWARNQPGVSVVSMSWGGSEFFNESSYDSIFTAPAGHAGVTFVASTGDDGQPAGYPAFSPNVVAVGGTRLTLSGSDYGSETGWNSSGRSTGGGISQYESQPSYQNGVVTQSSTMRTTPDVALDADPNTGVAIYDSFNSPASPWFQFGGTSLSAPMFAGLVAVANQGRVLTGQPVLDGRSDTLPRLYAAPAEDFHDITSGSNGFSAGPGYDLVTGRGSPVANLLIPDLVGVTGSISGHIFQDNNANGISDAGDTPLAGVTVYLDANNNGVFDTASSVTKSSGPLNLTIPSGTARPPSATSTQTITGVAGVIADVNINFSLNYPTDNSLTGVLIAPDGTQVTLFTGVGLFSPNFSNTTLDDQASTPIATGSAPFAGSFKPSSPLSVLNGKSANGNWKLKISNLSFTGDTGKLLNWSITVTTGSEVYTISAEDGSYTFPNLSGGSAYTVREVTPAGYTQAGPTSYSINVTGDMNGADFANVLPAPTPTIFTAPSPGSIYYLWLDPTGTTLNIGASAQQSDPVYQLALSSVQNLTFHLSSAGSKLILDFSNGAPLPQGNILVDGDGLADSELQILGQYSTNPNQVFTMSDTQVGLSGGPAVLYQNLGALTLSNALVNYTGTFSGVGNLTVDNGTVLNWVG